MKKLLALMGASAILLAACGQQTEVSSVKLNSNEQAIASTIGFDDSNFLSYQVENDKEITFEVYKYTKKDGVEKFSTTYSAENAAEREGTIAIGFLDDGKTKFKFGNTTTYLEDKNDYVSLSIRSSEGTVKIGKEPVLVKSFKSYTENVNPFESDIENEFGKKYTPYEAADVKEGQLIIDVVAYTK